MTSLSTVDRLTRELDAAKTKAKLSDATAKRAAERMQKTVARNQDLCDEVKALGAEIKLLRSEQKRFVSLLRRWDKVVHVNRLLGRELPDLVVDLGQDTADAIGRYHGEEIE